ncbi:MAG: DUF3109 family protein [Chloroflexota bacterium]
MIRIKSATSSVSISEVTEDIFGKRYIARCIDCQFCHDACCSWGCDVDRAEIKRIMAYQKELEKIVRVSAGLWFWKKTGKGIDYPSGEYRRTHVYHGKCVFYTAKPRGCSLHRLALEKGLDPHQLKPMVCFLFPVTWERGRLSVDPLLEEMPCKDLGRAVFEVQKAELRLYFGEDFVTELQKSGAKGRFSKA